MKELAASGIVIFSATILPKLLVRIVSPEWAFAIALFVAVQAILLFVGMLERAEKRN